MANECLFEMRVKGKRDSVLRVIECLKTDYNYCEGKPKHQHFFRIFNVYDEENIVNNGDGTFTVNLWGYCAWSVRSCMLEGVSTYYNDCKNSYPDDIFMGTNLVEQSKDCEIEVFSEEEGMGFSEHYYCKNGIRMVDECIDIQEGGYDDDGNITTDIDWDSYDGDWIVINPNRYNNTDEFRYKFVR